MSTTFLLAIYSSLLSTALGFITIFNFLKERKLLSVQNHFSYSLESASYTFVISNISSRPLTIFDCTICSLAKTENGKLEMDWDTSPKILKELFGEDDPATLILPITLTPGQILIITISSEEIIKDFQFYRKLSQPAKKWLSSNFMELEIVHSMSKKPNLTRFKLESDELEKSLPEQIR